MGFQIRIIEERNEVRVRNVPVADIEILENIAANMAQSLSSFLRGEFKKIIRNAEDDLKQLPECKKPETLNEAIKVLTEERDDLLLRQQKKKRPGRPKKNKTDG